MQRDTPHLSLPMRASEYEDYRFRLEADLVNEDGRWQLSNCDLILLDENDIALTDAMLARSDKSLSAGDIAEALGYIAENPLLCQITYDKSSKHFPAQEALKQAAEAV